MTVLFCDLVGSPSLAERLGPETMYLLLNRFFELALAEIHRYEGTIKGRLHGPVRSSHRS